MDVVHQRDWAWDPRRSLWPPCARPVSPARGYQPSSLGRATHGRSRAGNRRWKSIGGTHVGAAPARRWDYAPSRRSSCMPSRCRPRPRATGAARPRAVRTAHQRNQGRWCLAGEDVHRGSPTARRRWPTHARWGPPRRQGTRPRASGPRPAPGRRTTGTPCRRGRRGLAPSSLRPYWAGAVRTTAGCARAGERPQSGRRRAACPDEGATTPVATPASAGLLGPESSCPGRSMAGSRA